MEYYIVKSGMQMYDLSRAYGLSLILQKLSNNPIQLKDSGQYYTIETKTDCNIERIGNLAGLLLEETDKKWVYVFLTLKGNARNNEIRELKKSIMDRNTISLIIDRYKDLRQPEFFGSKKRNKTMYQSLDLSATKGFRENVKERTYNEGNQLYVSREDFLLSVTGHLNFTIFKWKGKEELTTILFNPSVEGVPIGISPDAREITKRIEELLRVHRAGVLSTLSCTAISLAKELSLQKYRVIKFSNLFFAVMIGAGQQRKPYGGGSYPLDFLYKIIESTSNSEEIFDLWCKIFAVSNRSGYEDLALYLSEFITYPSEETFNAYLKSHLGTFLTKNIKPALYECEIMQEVIKNV